MVGKESIVALLPMKAHSERVRGKNFRVFNGKPLFRWVLDRLLAVEEIGEVVINTDARGILASHGLVESGRVRIRDRKPELCGDFVSMNRILEDDIAAVPADVYLMTHVTNPLLSVGTIRRAVTAYRAAIEAGTHDSLFSVDRVQTRFYRQDGSPVNHDPANLVRTQDLDPWFEENSNLYLFSRDSFARTAARIGSRPLVFETPRIESLDIDEQSDWDLALLAAQWLESRAAGGTA